MAEAVSIREYGRRRGLSDTYIRRMISTGVISSRCMTVHPTNGRPMIIPNLADEDWEVHYPSSEKPERPKPQPQPKEKKTTRPANRKSVAAIPDEVVEVGRASSPGTLPDGRKSKAELDRLNAEVKLQLSALDLKERKGQLVDKDKVYRALYELGQETKRNVMSVADKTIDNILAAPNRAEAYQILYTALNDALTTVSNIKEGDLRLTERR